MRKFRRIQVGLDGDEMCGALETLTLNGWDIVSIMYIGPAYVIVYSRDE